MWMVAYRFQVPPAAVNWRVVVADDVGGGQPDDAGQRSLRSGTTGWPASGRTIDAAVAAYRASVDAGKRLSERKLAAMFGRISRRWARNRIAEARQTR